MRTKSASKFRSILQLIPKDYLFNILLYHLYNNQINPILYLYTLFIYKISDMLAAINSYKLKGFGLIPNFISQQTCNRAKNQIDKLIASYEPKPEELIPFSTEHDEYKRHDYYLKSGDKIRFFLEEGAYQNGKFTVPKETAINKVGHALHQKHKLFNEITYQRRIKQICNGCGIMNPLVLQSMTILKPPKVGSKVIVHQDSTFLYDQPTSLMGFWIPLQDATLENGCLWGLSGSHKGKLYTRSIMNWKEKYAQMKILHQIDYKQSDFEPIQMKKGSLIFFSGVWLHKSEANTSQKSRYAYTWHLKQKANFWSQENWLQRDPFPEFPYHDRII